MSGIPSERQADSPAAIPLVWAAFTLVGEA
jgi:hypothetical protein